MKRSGLRLMCGVGERCGLYRAWLKDNEYGLNLLCLFFYSVSIFYFLIIIFLLLECVPIHFHEFYCFFLLYEISKLQRYNERYAHAKVKNRSFLIWTAKPIKKVNRVLNKFDTFKILKCQKATYNQCKKLIG